MLIPPQPRNLSSIRHVISGPSISMVQAITPLFKHVESNTVVFFLCQALGFSNLVAITFIGGIVGAELAPSANLATLPLATLILGSVLFFIPAAHLMKLYGRKHCFIVSSAIATISLAACCYSVYEGSFWLFCLTSLLIGTNGAFIQQYRFAIIEGLSIEKHPTALTCLLIASAVGVIVGTLVFPIAESLSADYILTSLMIISVLTLISTTILFLYKPACANSVENKIIVSQVDTSKFWPMIFFASGAYFVMSFVMAPTPFQMCSVNDHNIHNASVVMQVHLLCMYIPSLSIKPLLQKYSVYFLLNTGLALLLFGVLVGFIGGSVIVHLISLGLIGVGWCYIFVVATMEVSKSYFEEYKFKSQAINDFSIFSFSALASFVSGTVVSEFGWNYLLLIALLVTIIMMIYSIFWQYLWTQRAKQLLGD